MRAGKLFQGRRPRRFHHSGRARRPFAVGWRWNIARQCPQRRARPRGGSKLRMIAVNYQAPYAIFSLKNAQTSASPAARGLNLSSGAGSFRQGDRRLHGPEGPRPEQAQDRQRRSAGAPAPCCQGKYRDEFSRPSRGSKQRQSRQCRAAPSCSAITNILSNRLAASLSRPQRRAAKAFVRAGLKG